MKDCNQCGKCCINYGDGGLSASASEIQGWQDYRPDIYQHVRDGEIWFDPDTGQRLQRCPFLRQNPADKKYSCDIYQDRPDDCRYYPVSIADMLADECEMLEVRDLGNKKQSQKTLDALMADSRPPLMD